MGDPVFVLALMGISPGVVTELLWHLVAREGRRVAGVEIWTTAHRGAFHAAGADPIERLASLYATLVDQLGPAADLPPLRTARPAPCRPDVPRGEVRVVAFDDPGGGSLVDVTSDAQARSVAAQLHDRLRDLTAALPDVPIVGSVAGGRKTMSASLQTAFALHGRPEDRLVHVLLHPRLEQDRELMRSYACPVGPVGDVPPEAQIAVHEVAFPRLRSIVPELGELLAKMPYEALCERLTAGAADRALLAPRTERAGRLVLYAGAVELARVDLSPRSYEAYAILAKNRAPMHERDLKQALDGLGCGRNVDATRVMQRLKKELREHPMARAYDGFVPRIDRGAWSVPMAAAVEVT